MTELAFVMSPRQNWFFKELVEAIRNELHRQAIPSSLHLNGFPPPRPDRAYVLVPPHEYVALEGVDALPSDEMLRRTVFLCAEQPGTIHFDQNIHLAERAGAVFDINRAAAVAMLREGGIEAQHFQLGYTPRWDRFDPKRQRDIDVVFLGCRSQRRLRYLNSYARTLSRWNCHIQLSDNSRPNTEGSFTFLADEKWKLLARAKLVVNLHQGDARYFEWLRVIDAVHCGAVVVSEHSSDIAPLRPGRHLFLGRPESLGLIADALLRDEPRLQQARQEAYSFVRSSLPMAKSVAGLAAAARVLVAQPLPRRVITRFARTSTGPPPDPFPAIRPEERTESDVFRRQLKELRLSQIDIMRQLTQIQHRLDASNGDGEPRWVRREYQTVAWRARRSVAVTVLTALFNQGHLIHHMLDSVDRSRFRDFELVVVDDGSTDGSGDRVLSWMRGHEDVPALLVRHSANRGLGAARNTALAFARGRHCLVLDADNEIYPRCLEALVGTLDSDPHAVFAYPILETFGTTDQYIARGGGAHALVSHLGWDPRRFRSENYIDALSLIRTHQLRALGGYTTDKRCHGWEDYDLWCTVAERGWYGRQVPQMLARYRVSPTSMLTLTGVSVTTAIQAMIERHPALMAD